MKIAIGGDHAGFSYKKKIIEYLNSNGITTIDVGPKMRHHVITLIFLI